MCYIDYAFVSSSLTYFLLFDTFIAKQLPSLTSVLCQTCCLTLWHFGSASSPLIVIFSCWTDLHGWINRFAVFSFPAQLTEPSEVYKHLVPTEDQNETEDGVAPE